ncbi:MAG TPA: prepilin-type N-terminal cleavage/methylation domain-containing protein [Candidatus Saccharimonadales bacterium]
MSAGRVASKGFTIMEVLIVLTITAVLFLSATALISGKQDQTEFDQAIRQVQSQVQQTIGDISNGYFPGLNNFTCSAGSNGPVITSGTGSGQGTNTGCIFVGKVLRFGVNASSALEQFQTYTIAGLQQDSGGNNVTSLSAAMPVVIAPSTLDPGAPDDSILNQLQNGLSTYQNATTSGGNKISGIALVSTFAPADVTQSSAQNVDLIPIYGSMSTASSDAINTALRSSPPINPSGGAQVCFVSGTTNQSGLITIGSDNSTLSVTLLIKDNKTCS